MDGLREFLRDVFTQPPDTEGAAETADEPDPVPLEIHETTMVVDKRGGTASFTVSDNAAATVEIRDADGQRVRTLASGIAVEGGVSVALDWDRTDDNGKRVRRGTYRLHVDAADADGQTAHASVSFDLP